MRNNPTEAEKLLWEELRKSKLGYRITRQYSVCGYVVDFYCSEKRLALEIDGEIHTKTVVYDKYKDKYKRCIV